jgi:hypothetical protein
MNPESYASDLPNVLIWNSRQGQKAEDGLQEFDAPSNNSLERTQHQWGVLWDVAAPLRSQPLAV